MIYNIESKKKIKEYYFDKKLVNNYLKDRFKSPIGVVLHETQVNFVNNIIKIYNIKKLLEIAPGPARISIDIKGFDSGVMVDSSENMLKLAKKRIKYNRWSFKNADIFDFDTKEKFDLIYSFRFIRHLDYKERMKIYSKIRYLLKSEGLLIFDA